MLSIPSIASNVHLSRSGKRGKVFAKKAKRNSVIKGPDTFNGKPKM
jgi:hypothetical protein